MQTAVRRCTLAVRMVRKVFGHDAGAELPQVAFAVVGGDGVPLTMIRGACGSTGSMP